MVEAWESVFVPRDFDLLFVPGEGMDRDIPPERTFDAGHFLVLDGSGGVVIAGGFYVGLSRRKDRSDDLWFCWYDGARFRSTSLGKYEGGVPRMAIPAGVVLDAGQR